MLRLVAANLVVIKVEEDIEAIDGIGGGGVSAEDEGWSAEERRR